MEFKGIDVSKWQGEINWEKVKKSGIEFAIIREGYGKKSPNQIDKKFKENIEGAKKAGINCGVYHYSYADSIADAKLEAEFCLENIRGYKLEYPIVIDIEDKEMLKLTNHQRTDICRTFCEEIEKNGYYAMIYTSYSWLKNYLYTEELLKDFDLWLAQWGSNKSYSCGIWQYSEIGIIDGINGNVDLNIAYKNYPEIMQDKGLNGFKSNKNGASEFYTVAHGDTLSSIGKKFGISISELAAKNNIKNIDLIYAGDILKIK